MTEAEWLTLDNPARLLKVVRSHPWRKRCLYACACWSTAREFLGCEDSWSALASLEEASEAELPNDTFESVATFFCNIGVDEDESLWHAPFGADGGRFRAASIAATAAGDYDEGEAAEEWDRLAGEFEEESDAAGIAWGQLGRELCDLARCVFGNPFRPTCAVSPAWLEWDGAAVRKLARSAYDECPLHEGPLHSVRLAVLADALEDAGYTDAELLGHLRGPGPHVRGCWAVDLV